MVDVHIETRAAAVLANFWIQDAHGRPSVPVDPILIARSLGLDVFFSYLDPDVAGILLKEKGGTPQIHLNARDPLVRQRFTCGHEVGHYIRRSESDDADFGYVDKRDALSARGTDPEERWANGFAAALLMPADVVRARRDYGAEKLAAEMKVSLEAMRNRLSNL